MISVNQNLTKNPYWLKKIYKTKMSPHFLNLQFMQHIYDFSFSREFGTQWLPTNNQKNLVLFSVAQPIINHHKGQKKKFSRSKKKELKKKPVTWILSLHNELWISLLWNLMRHSLLFVWLLYTVVESLCCHKKNVPIISMVKMA